MSRRRVGLHAALIAISVTLMLLFTSSRAGELLKLVLEYSSPGHGSPVVDPFLIDLQERTFRFFWDTANPKNGLIPDRFPTPSYSSIAAVGFGLTAYPVGVERGYITREQARQARADDAALLPQRAAGPRGQAACGLQGLLLPLPRHEDRAALRGQRAVHGRHRDPAGRRAVLPVVLRRHRRRGSRDPQARRRDLRARRLALGAAARARDQPRLVARRRLPRIRLARLQRGDAGLPARARLADAPGRARSVGRVDEHLRHDQLAHASSARNT